MVNVFALASCPKKSARMQCDAHVVKMLLEAVQMLYAVWGEHAHECFTVEPYRLTHKNHPMTKWAGSCFASYMWLLKHARALCNEYTKRYEKQHKCEQHIEQLELAGCPAHVPVKDDGEWIESLKNAVLADEDVPDGCSVFPLCMGDHLEECVERNKSGRISATRSVQSYYKLKKDLFKKPFRYKKQEFDFGKWYK